MMMMMVNITLSEKWLLSKLPSQKDKTPCTLYFHFLRGIIKIHTYVLIDVQFNGRWLNQIKFYGIEKPPSTFTATAKI